MKSRVDAMLLVHRKIGWSGREFLTKRSRLSLEAKTREKNWPAGTLLLLRKSNQKKYKEQATKTEVDCESQTRAHALLADAVHLRLVSDRRPTPLLTGNKSKVERSGGRKTHQNRTEAKENQSAGETERNGPGCRQWRQDQKRWNKNQNHSSTKHIAQIHNMSKEENQTTQLKIQK
jgi:hypothetical protein